VVNRGDYSPISPDINWEGFAFNKPLLQSGSKGIDEFSVSNINDRDAMKEKVEQSVKAFRKFSIPHRGI